MGLFKSDYPTRWLSYTQRVRDDVETLYNAEGGKDFFDEKYVENLTKIVENLEKWEITLFAYQLTVCVFIVLGLMESDASLSVFGISFKTATGLKELLLGISVTLTVFIYAVSSSKKLRLAVLGTLTKLKTDARFHDVARLAMPSEYNMQVYIAKQYEKWIFATWWPQLTFRALCALMLAWMIFIMGLSWTLWWFVATQIWNQPTLGIWSNIAVIYAVLCWGMCALWWVHANARLPYRDKSELKK